MFRGLHMKSFVMPTLTRAWNADIRWFGVVSVILGLVAYTQCGSWCVHHNNNKFSGEKFSQNWGNSFLMDWCFSTRLGTESSIKISHKIFWWQLSVLEWSWNSSDLNPIENLWCIYKQRLCKMDCTTMQKLISKYNSSLVQRPKDLPRLVRTGWFYARSSLNTSQESRKPYHVLRWTYKCGIHETNIKEIVSLSRSLFWLICTRV